VARNENQAEQETILERVDLMRVRELLALILALLMAMPAVAQDPQVVAANVGGMTVEELRVTVSKSLVIDYPADISRISTSNPDIVDAVPATSREFLLHGKGHGSATVVVWAKNGLRTMYNVTVEHNLDPIKRLLKDTFPNENIGVMAGRDSITLIGMVSTKDVVDRAVAIATPLAKTVVSNLSLMTVPVSRQIVIKVRFAELNRTAAQQFGVNLLTNGAGNTTGGITTQQFAAPTVGTDNRVTITDALNIFAFRRDLNLTALVRALQSQGLLQILAEPNLVTTNGKEASFLVGGEFPVPVLQGGANAGAVTIQFREFGIRLLFNPVITENNTIKLYVKPEVSTIDLANAVTLSGFTIPALATRRMETNIELGFGQSFVIAGLIDDRVTEQFNKLPGLSSIPILGALFRSRTMNRSKSELVIIVTPEVATPLNAGDPKPEPAWLKPFMMQQHPGDKVGTDLVPGISGGVAPPMRPGHTQIDRESVGNGAKAHPVTPMSNMIQVKPEEAPKADKAKDGIKAEAEPGKHNPLKLFGRKGTKAEPKAEKPAAFQFTPWSGQQSPAPLAPAIATAPETMPARETMPSRETRPAGEVKPVETVPAPENAVPVRTSPSVPVQAMVIPALTAPETAVPPPAAAESKAETPPAENVSPELKPMETKPAEAKPGEGKPAVELNPARRRLSAGITSLPPQVVGGQSTPSAGSATLPSSGAQQ